jgi:hypothetical protein
MVSSEAATLQAASPRLDLRGKRVPYVPNISREHTLTISKQFRLPEKQMRSPMAVSYSLG